MLEMRYVPAANWPTFPFQGPQMTLIDENNRLGFWNGASYSLPGAGGGGLVTSVNGLQGVVVLDKTHIGLPLAANLAPADYPVSNAQAASIALMIPLAQKGVANGVASLGSDGKVPAAQLPVAVGGGLNYIGTWNASTNTPAIPTAAPENNGHYRVVDVAGSTNINGISVWDVGDWIISNGTTWDKIVNSATVVSVAGKTGVVVLVKGDVGLGNVDNTSDANKPVSTAQAAADALKIDLTQKGAINGVASLDGTGKVPVAQLPVSGIAGHVVEDEGVPLTQRGTVNFVGAGVTAADSGGKTVVTIPGAPAITFEDEGSPLTQRSSVNFVGAGVTAADSGGKTVITIPGASGSSGHVIEEEGTPLAQRTNMNFTGAGVAVTDAGGKTVITIPGGAGGSFFGGSDRTEVVLEADPVNIGQQRVLSEKVDGIPWTYAYNAQGTLIQRSWVAGGLDCDITGDFGIATGNIFVLGHGIKVNTAQMPTLTAAMLAQNTPASAVIWVHDYDGGRGIYLQWQNSDQGWRGAYGAPVVVAFTNLDDPAGAWTTSTSESAARWTVTIPGWLSNKNSEFMLDALFLGSLGTSAKQAYVYQGGQRVANMAVTAANSFEFGGCCRWANRNARNLQWRGDVATPYHFGSGQTAATSDSAIDTTANVDVTISYDASGTVGSDTLIFKRAKLQMLM